MEQVLSVYERPYDEPHPVVCLDESPRQPLEIKQERKGDGTLLQDSEYIRKGVAEIYFESKEKLAAHLQAWQTRRNEKKVKADWHFTDKDARVKLAKLYPTL